MPGVREFLGLLAARGVRRAVLTRNARALAISILRRFSLHFDPIIGREDGPVKPDPAAIRAICETWQLHPSEVLMVGDFRFDMEAGHRAGARTVLYTRGRKPERLPGIELADVVLPCFHEAERLLLE